MFHLISHEGNENKNAMDFKFAGPLKELLTKTPINTIDWELHKLEIMYILGEL